MHQADPEGLPLPRVLHLTPTPKIFGMTSTPLTSSSDSDICGGLRLLYWVATGRLLRSATATRSRSVFLAAAMSLCHICNKGIWSSVLRSAHGCYPDSPEAGVVQECKMPGSDLESPHVCPTDRFIHPDVIEALDEIRLPGFVDQLQVPPPPSPPPLPEQVYLILLCSTQNFVRPIPFIHPIPFFYPPDIAKSWNLEAAMSPDRFKEVLQMDTNRDVWCLGGRHFPSSSLHISAVIVNLSPPSFFKSP